MHLCIALTAIAWVLEPSLSRLYTRGDQKVRGKVLLNRIAFIDCNENA